MLFRSFLKTRTRASFCYQVWWCHFCYSGTIILLHTLPVGAALSTCFQSSPPRAPHQPCGFGAVIQKFKNAVFYSFHLALCGSSQHQELLCNWIVLNIGFVLDLVSAVYPAVSTVVIHLWWSPAKQVTLFAKDSLSASALCQCFHHAGSELLSSLCRCTGHALKAMLFLR